MWEKYDIKRKRKLWYDKNCVKREFKEGDKVMVLAMSPTNKLSVQWHGPGTVEGKISDTNYIVSLPGKREKSQIYHINLLKPYHSRSEMINLVEHDEMNDPPDLEVEFPFYESDPNVFNFVEIVQYNNMQGRLSSDQIETLEGIVRKFSEIGRAHV